MYPQMSMPEWQELDLGQLEEHSPYKLHLLHLQKSQLYLFIQILKLKILL